MTALPRSLEDVGAPWLTDVLQARFPGVEVAGVEILEHQHGTNRNGRLRLDHAGSADAPDVVFVKLPPADPQQRDLVIASGMGRREAVFYERLADRVPMRVPRPYFAQHDDATGGFAILVEDLPSSGCRVMDGSAGVSQAFAAQAMDDFAALHASLPAREGASLGAEPLLRMRSFGVGMLEHALASRGDSLKGEFRAMAELYVAAFDGLHDLWESGEQSVVHGDGHLTNLFEDGGRAGFFDWGCFSLAPPLRDVSYFLCMALDVEHRRAAERDLIERYLERRKQLGAPGPSRERAFEQHRLHAGYTVVASAPAALHGGAVTPGDPAYGRAFVARASAAVEDLESVPRLRAALDS